MPFGTFYPVPLPSPGLPPPGPSGEAPSQPDDHAGLRLDGLPCEILIRIGHWLPRNEVLSLSRGNRTVWHAICRDLIQPLRLRERIRWINSLSEIHAALIQVLAEPWDRRARLLGKLEKRANALHPRMRGLAMEALQPHLPSPHGQLPTNPASPQEWQALQQLASRLAWNDPGRDPATLAPSFDDAFALTCRLPIACQGKVLAALARCMSWKTLRHASSDPDALPPRLARFIQYVRSSLPPADAASVLGDLAGCGDARDDPLDRPLRMALLAAAKDLPDAACARLLAAILGSHPSPSQAFAPLWLAAFEAAATVAQTDAMSLYEVLASRRAELPEEIEDRCWHALARRLDDASDPAAMLPALLGLADARSRMSLDRRAELLRIARKLPPLQLGTLCAAMVVRKDITPMLWRAQVKELAALPVPARLRPARELIDLLSHYESNGAFAAGNLELDGDVELEDCDPAGLACERFPGGVLKARRKASDLLALLSLMDRGTVLLHLLKAYAHRCPGPTSVNWDLSFMEWLLQETTKLAPFRHNSIGLLTGLCRVAASACPTQADAHRLGPLLIAAVRAVPAQDRASALFYLGSLIDRFEIGPAISWGANLAALPAVDAAAAKQTKRKGAPH